MWAASPFDPPHPPHAIHPFPLSPSLSSLPHALSFRLLQLSERDLGSSSFLGRAIILLHTPPPSQSAKPLVGRASPRLLLLLLSSSSAYVSKPSSLLLPTYYSTQDPPPLLNPAQEILPAGFSFRSYGVADTVRALVCALFGSSNLPAGVKGFGRAGSGGMGLDLAQNFALDSFLVGF
jgi:hypothetical protein